MRISSLVIRQNIPMLVKSVTVFLYFILLTLHNVYQNQIVDFLWYFVLLSSFILGTFKRKFVIRDKVLLFFLLFILSTGVNTVLIGNSSLLHIAYLLLYVGVYCLLTDDKVDNDFIKAAIYFNCVFISLLILRKGLGNPVFVGLSNNFVSVLILVPTVVYYVRMEFYQKKISIKPAIAMTITCLLSLGRGGIIVSGMILIFVLWYVAFVEKSTNNKNKQLFLIIGGVVFVMIIVITLAMFTNQYLTIPVFGRFMKYGMYDTGRLAIWEEYLSTIAKDINYIIWGVDFKELSLMVRYRNNLHNSFFNIHAYYGIFVLSYVLIVLFFNATMCIREKRWLYLLMMFVFFARSFTDKIFGGGSAATPVLFFFLWYLSYASRGSNSMETSQGSVAFQNGSL